MTRAELIRRLQNLSDEHYNSVAPFIEADLESAEELASLHREITAGRNSAKTEPILEAKDVYARVREALSK